MAVRISASVGVSGRNLRPDVVTIQQLLAQKGMQPGTVDGICGTKTVHAILSFQKMFLSHPDGRVDPNGTTWHHLVSHSSVTANVPPSTHPVTSLTTLVPRPASPTINQGLEAVTPRFMVDRLGSPRQSYTADCQPMTDEVLRKHVTTASVGRFKVTGLTPAVDSLRNALVQVQREQPDVYAALGTAGMLCCRLVRGSKTAISNHSWGTAIDFTLNGLLDQRGNNKVQLGLTLIAPIMNRFGWYWGAAFRTEDAMHFEASRSLIDQWAHQIR